MTPKPAIRSLGLALLLVVVAVMAAAPASGAAKAPCRVRNVTQDTYGQSLIRMVDKAKDGDRLRVRGTCRGEVVIRRDLVIVGRGVRPTITGRDLTRSIRIGGGAAVRLQNLVITHGRALYGAGLRNNGTTTLVGVIVRSSRARANGGGISDHYELTLIDSKVRLNSARYRGGGLMSWNLSEVVLRGSTVARNRAETGGGLEVDGTSVHLQDSVIRNNRARAGGGVLTWGDTVLTGSVVTDNVASDRGGGISNAGWLILAGTTVTGNRASVEGGGIWTELEDGDLVDVEIDASSSVTGNTPDDCVGTPAC